ncbi:hypothetical protein Hypma_002913 [Hypsizygus marmoreus]|uniref:F-box domain-containing protein n=1 Tax=Hypsizygus marmoreus TaxID=39966 RepID=A0A369J3I8_HYPMA|nr:hypothetical protein Hypma_002913 [Hypsizygus marmoreus]
MLLASSIPEDVIITIVEPFIHDRPTLKSCALIAQSFRFPSQKLLYTEIRLHLTRSDPNPPTRAQRLHEIVTKNPLLGTFVRKLDLLCEAKADDGAGVLNLMTQLRKLKVVILPQWGTDDPCPWGSLGPGLRDGLCHLMRIPELEHVHLHGMSGFPVEHLPSASKVVDVTLSTVSLDNTAVSVTLPSIFFRGFGYEAVLKSIDIDTCQLVLRMSANTLEHFRFSVMDVSTGFLDDPIGLQKLDLSPLKTLQSLQISFSLDLSRSRLADFESFLATSIPVCNSLISFTLEDTMNSHWYTIDRILCDARCLSKTRISIRDVCHVFSNGKGARFIWVTNWFGNMRGKGLINDYGGYRLCSSTLHGTVMLTVSDIAEDILIAILDGLHADQPALRACPHTARLFRLPSQKLLVFKNEFYYIQRREHPISPARRIQVGDAPRRSARCLEMMSPTASAAATRASMWDCGAT